MSALLAKFWGTIVALAVGALAFGGALFAARRSGAKAEQQKQKETELSQVKEANAIDRNIRATTDDAIARDLRQYRRD